MFWKKESTNLVGALSTLLQRNTANKKQNETHDLLTGLKRLVKAATEGKIPLETDAHDKPPKKNPPVAKANANDDRGRQQQHPRDGKVAEPLIMV